MEAVIVGYGINPDDAVTCYITSLYWSVMTMATVGYGDVVSLHPIVTLCSVYSLSLFALCALLQPPQTNGERVVATLCMLVGASAFAYVLGSITGLIANLDKESAEYATCRTVAVVHLIVTTAVFVMQAPVTDGHAECIHKGQRNAVRPEDQPHWVLQSQQVM